MLSVPLLHSSPGCALLTPASVCLSVSQGGAPVAHPEDELERLTKKMLFDMDNPPSEEYFGKILTLTSSIYASFFFLLAKVAQSQV